MKTAAFKSRNQLDDALTIATSRPASPCAPSTPTRIEGRLGIRDSAPGEELEGRPGELPAGDAGDRRRAAAARRCCSGPPAEGRGVHPSTERIVLVAIQVKGVPEIAVEEALWLAAR